MQSVGKILGSNRLAAGLIGVLSVQILLSALIPQQDVRTVIVVGTEDLLEASSSVVGRLQLDRITASYAFQINLALLAVCLVAGNHRRLQRFRRLRGARMRVRRLGSLVFHFSLLLIVAGVFLNSATQFDGVLALTEGQTVRDYPPAYLQTTIGTLAGDRFDRFELELLSLDAGTDGIAQLRIVGDGQAVPFYDSARVNHPIRWQDLEFHMGLAVGYSPEIILWDEQGTQTLRSFVRVHVRDAGPDSVVHEDYVDHWGNGRRLRIRVLPTQDVKAPGFELAIMADGQKLASSRAAVGDTLELDGSRIAIPRCRRWCYIYVVRNPWLNVVFAGFWLALAGQAVSAVARVTTRKGGRDE